MRGAMLTLASLVGLLSTGCAGFKSLERGEWVLAWSDEVVQNQMVNGTALEVVKPAPGSRQEVIPQDRYDAEVTEGRRRRVVSTFQSTPELVTEVGEHVEMRVGEVLELRIDESRQAEVWLAGDAVKAYWTKVNTLDEWKDGQPIERKESMLYLLADEPGSARVKVVLPGSEPKLIEVMVHSK